MKFKALVITILFVAGVAASVALAKGPPPGKGKGTEKDKKHETTSSTTGSTSTVACKPKVAVILKGDFVSGSGSDDEGVFQMKVRQANKHGKRYLAETVTIAYDEKTKFRRRGHAELDDFAPGDSLNVQARACKDRKPKKGSTTTGSTTTGATGSTAALLAKRVIGKPARTSTTTTGTTTAP